MENQTYTLEDLTNQENELVLNAEQVHGEYFTVAKGWVALMNNLASSVNRPERFIFIIFISQIKKQLTLALFSAVRRHHVQMGMNLRQVLEASAWAAYALAHEELSLFHTENDHGGAEVPERLSRARNSWLDTNYHVKSEEMKRLKDQINNTIAHSNIIYASQTFALNTTNPGYITTFFDNEEDFRVKKDLLMIANFAMEMIDLFMQINQNEQVFHTSPEFNKARVELTSLHDTLRTAVGIEFARRGLGN